MECEFYSFLFWECFIVYCIKNQTLLIVFVEMIVIFVDFLDKIYGIFSIFC